MILFLSVVIGWLTYYLIGCYVYHGEYDDSWFEDEYTSAISQGLSPKEAREIISLYVALQKYKWPIKLYKDSK